MAITTPIDLAVSFDTTGSMYPVLTQVRDEVSKFVKDMFKEFTDLRISIIAHGDYCDRGNPYTIRIQDFTTDEDALCRFVKETKSTYGGDADECYELVLNSAHRELNWRSGAQKAFIMIGDAAPHGVNYPQNEARLDWRKEAVTLSENDIKVYAVHALAGSRSSSRGFYTTVAETTMGCYLTLDQFSEIIELIKGTCYQQGGITELDKYIEIIKTTGIMSSSLDRNFRRLKGEKVEEPSYTRSYSSDRGRSYSPRATGAIKEMGELVPVNPGRFQVMEVPEKTSIRAFVEGKGIPFVKGRGFYELTKAETIQQYKEIILVDPSTGEMFNGTQVREKLGLKPQTESGGVNERLTKADAKGLTIFVQSTSYNRALIGGTKFMYEIADYEDKGTVIEAETLDTAKKTKTKEETEDMTAKERIEAMEKAATATKKAATKKTAKASKKTETADKPAKKSTAKKAPAKKTTKSKVEVTPVETVKPTAKDRIDLSAVAKIAEEKKVTAKKSTKATAKKATAVKVETVNREGFETAVAKVNEALDRIDKSTCKKNKTFLANQLKKLKAEIEKIETSVE